MRASADLRAYRRDPSGEHAERLFARFGAALDAREGPRMLSKIRRTLGTERTDEFIGGFLSHLAEVHHTDSADRILSVLRDRVLDSEWDAKAFDAALTAAEALSSEGHLDTAGPLLHMLIERETADPRLDRRVTALVVRYLKTRLAAADVEGAEPVARAFVARKPEYAPAVLSFEDVLVRMGHDAEADELLRKALAADRDQARYVFRHATRLYDGLEVESADRLMAAFVAAHPDEGTVLRLYVRKLLWRLRFDDAITLLERALETRADQELLAYLVEAHLGSGDVTSARASLARFSALHGLDLRDGWAEAQILAAEGELESAVAHLDALQARATDDRTAQRIAAAERSRLRVRLDTAGILETAPLDSVTQGVTVLVTHGSPLFHVWMGLVARELRLRGFATVILEQDGVCPIAPTGDPDIDELQGIIDISGRRLRAEPSDQGLRHDWTIDVPGGVVAAEGFNFLQAIRSRIGTALRRYRFDFDHPLAREILDDHVQKADAMLAVCERIAETLGRRGIPVRFLAGMSHYVPAVVIRQFCSRFAGELDIQHIEFMAAYQHYYNNMAEITSSALSVANLTRHPELTQPGRAQTDKFESWLAELTSERRAEYLSDVDDIIAFDRAGIRLDPRAEEVHRRIVEHKAAGKPVVCLLGKVLYDIWMDDPSGPVHGDIVEWVRHSVEAVRGSDTLLLIKPHPDEIKPEIARPTEYFLELVPEDLPDNVIVLQHKWFNIKQLLPFIDCGVLWSGTSGLELQASGIPVVVCSRVGASDYPVSFFVPTDRDDYVRLLREPARLDVARETKERCALLLKYLSTPDIITPYPYAHMPYLRGVNPGTIQWKMDRVQTYLAEGDPYVTEIAEQCL